MSVSSDDGSTLNEFSSSSDVSQDGSEGKKRSFLQPPRSYSKLPAPITPRRELPSDVGVPKTQPIPIPPQAPLTNTTTDQIDAPEFFIGDRVCIGGIKTGTLLYFGTIHVAPGYWCGISLDEPDGIHDGLVNDIRYFTCRKGHGIFAPLEKVKHLDIKTTLNTVSNIVKAPSRVSPIPSKSKVCLKDPLDSEFEVREYNNKGEQESDDEIIGLDENGILHDSDEEDNEDKAGTVRQVPRRKLPTLPRSNSQGLSRVQYMKMESAGDKSELDEAAERLRMLSEEEGLVKDIKVLNGYEVVDLLPSTAGSSGGEDSWSLSKDYLAMCDGNQSYLNITFDGDPESKASTQEASSKEPSEESPSPEFIFDQEMLEDGEFSSQPLEMSRDSSLGLLSSLALEKTDLMFELGDGLDEIYVDNLGSQDTLEPNSQEKMPTPERQQDMNCSLEFDENDVECSTPFVEKIAPSKRQSGINETFVKEEEHADLNSTFTKDGDKTAEAVVNETFTKSPVQKNLNSTFCLSEKAEAPVINEVIASVKANDNNKREMVDSGISLRGSMTESAISINSLRGSMTDYSSVRGSMIDQLGHGQTFVSSQGGGVVDSDHDNSAIEVASVLVKDGELVQTVVEGSKSNLAHDEVIHAEMDDSQLISDLKRGHQRRQRPISYISTTSADTGYVPDTDSEVGTLTLNSPQEWIDKGFNGTHDHTGDSHGRSSTGLDRSGERITMMEPVPIESDSDVGTMTGDTDNEVDRAEIVHPVEACETRLSGVVLEEITEGDVSDDDNTQTGDVPDDKANSTITIETANTGDMGIEERSESNLDSTFTLAVSESSDHTNNSGNTDSCETTDSISIVTVVIADADESEKKNESQTDNKKENKEKQKTPKKKKFNVVKDFKKPNTNVVSKLSEYFKAPLPPKPVKEDKANTEEAKNKRNSLKGKIDFSKVTSKIANKVVENKVTEDKNENKKEIIEKEPVKKVKRTPPKSKWDSIMNQISDQKPKPITEVKSKLEAIINAPSPVKKTEEAAPKPKRRISMGIPDYSKVQSKLSYSALPRISDNKTEDTLQKSKSDTGVKKAAESPNRSKNQSPARHSSDTLKGNLKDKLRRKSSAVILRTTEGQSRSVDTSPSRSRRLSEKGDRQRNMSGESPKRPGIKDKMVHIDLGESLDGRGSRTGTGSIYSSRQSSVTDMSTTGVEEDTQDGLQRAMSEELVRRNSMNVETESQASVDMDTKLQNGEINQQRRKSSLVAPKILVIENTIGDGTKNKGGPKIVKPVIRQHSAPAPLTGSRNRSPASLPPSKAVGEKKTKRYRSRNQNRNKKPKKDEKPKPPETVLAEFHNKEVHRLEALCESRTKQLTYAKLQMQSCEKAFDGMAVMANHLAHNLDAFACPSLKTRVSVLEKEAVTNKSQIATLEETRANQEEIIGRMKEEHRAYVNNLEAESEKSLLYQREYLTDQHQHDIKRMQEKKNTAIFELRKSHEEYIEQKRKEHHSLVEQLKQQHREEICSLQRKQEFQMEELHKQHQDKLEEITNRFDGIKCTLSDKVDCLRSECDRLRDRAKHCEEALQRDSDFKVQCALAPYKNLPQEIESLKLVVEMRNEEINKLRNQNTELHKKLEELPIAQEKIIALQQKKENLEAIISMKTDHEKTLHERCQNLMKKYDKESRANKRLSMEYEELMYKLSESFSETEEMSQQEAAFYKKLGMSPTNEIPGSPGVSRRLRSTSSSESSPSKSPHYRRPVSAILDDRGREDKKLHRRSGNFLIDERRKTQRSTSPLTKENPLTRSWSPSTQTPTSPSVTDKSKNRLSQSWCVDVFDDDVISVDSTIDKQDEIKHDKVTDSLHDSSGPTTKSLETDTNLTSDIGMEKVANSEICVEQLSKNTVELQQTERVRNSDTPTKPKDNITGLTSDIHGAVTDSIVRPGDGEFNTNNINNTRSSSGVESAVLSTATLKCPPSKIPTNVTAEKRETKIPTRSHRESAV